MKIVRFNRLNLKKPSYGILEEDNIYELKGSILNSPKPGKFLCKSSEINLIAPCEPSKIVCLAINYKGIEGYSKAMLEPLVFIKPPTSIASPGDKIINPFPNLRWWGEAELAVVIKNKIKNIDETSVSENILGFTIANDTTVENIDSRDHHLARSKCPDKFCSIGPWIDTDFDASDCLIQAIQNGEIIRQGKSSEQIWKWPKIISWLSTWMTLEPLDIVLTGNPPDTVGMRYLNDGDNYKAKIEGLGELSNNFYLKKTI